MSTSQPAEPSEIATPSALQAPAQLGSAAPPITGLQAFRVEELRYVKGTAQGTKADDTPPFYEVYGEHQVAAGHYREVIRYQEHVRPLLEALQHHAGLSRP